MKTVKTLFVILLVIFTACNSSDKKASTHIVVDLRNQVNQTAVTTLADEIKGVSYVPLEMTTDDASVIDGIANFAVSDKYIYVLPAKEMRVVLFGRDGKFIRNLINSGQGPGEFTGSICTMQFDRKNNRLYLFDVQDVWIYTEEGEFIEKRYYDFMSIMTYNLSDNEIGAISFPFVPFKQGSFGMGIFTSRGDTVVIENEVFYSSLVSEEKSGFTMDVATCFSDYPASILFKCGSNDTIYRIKSNGIERSWVVKLDNSDKQIVRSLDITDFSVMSNLEDGNDIAITDLMETEKNLYLRFRYQQLNHVASIHKESGNVVVEKCVQPADYMTLAKANLLQGMSGTKSYLNFPIWGRVENKELIQVITPYEMGLYGNTSITIPAELKHIKEDDNPVFIFYKL